MFKTYLTSIYKIFAKNHFGFFSNKIKISAIAFVIAMIPSLKANAFLCRTMTFTGATETLQGLGYTYHNNLDADGNSKVKYTLSGGGHFSNGSTQIEFDGFGDVVATWDAAGTYTIKCETYNQGILCGGKTNQSQTLTVNVHPMPNSISFTKLPTCTDLQYDVTTNGPTPQSPSYVWSVPSGWAINNGVAPTSGTAAKASDGSLRSGTVSLAINTPWGSRNYSVFFNGAANPEAYFTNSYVTICAVNGQVVLDPIETAGVAPYTYSWTKGSAPVACANCSAITVKGTDIKNNEEIYTVTIAGANGCSANFSAVVTKDNGLTGWRFFPMTTSSTPTTNGQQPAIDKNDLGDKKTDIVTEANGKDFYDGTPYYVGANGHIWTYNYILAQNKWVNLDLTPTATDLATGSLAIYEPSTGVRIIYYVTASNKIGSIQSADFGQPFVDNLNVAGVNNATAIKVVDGVIYYKTTTEGISKIDITTGVITDLTGNLRATGNFEVVAANSKVGGYNVVFIEKNSRKINVISSDGTTYEVLPSTNTTWGTAVNNPIDGTHLEAYGFYVYFITEDEYLNRVTFNYNVPGIIETTHNPKDASPIGGYTGQFSINKKSGVIYATGDDYKVHQVYFRSVWTDNANIGGTVGMNSGFIKMHDPNVFVINSDGFLWSIFYRTDACQPIVHKMAAAPSVEDGISSQASTSSVESLNVSATPNPVNDFGTVSYVLPSASEVQVSITTLLGEDVLVLEKTQSKAAGEYRVDYSAANLNTGMYFVKVSVNGEAKSLTKLVVTK